MTELSEACGEKRNLITKRYYAVTIKPNHEHENNYESIDSMITFLFNNTAFDRRITDICYEVDCNNKLHCHAVLESMSPVQYTKYSQKGWHIYMKPLKYMADVKYWKQYCVKGPPLDQVLIEHESRKTYMFVP